MRLRFLPLMILFTAISLGVRITDIFVDSDQMGYKFSNFALFVNTAHANAGGEGEAKKEAKKPEKKDKSAKSQNEINHQCRNSIAITGKELCTPGQIELLKQLSTRRETIDKQSRALVDRENIIKLTENQVNVKLEEIKNIRGEIQNLLKELEQKEDEKIDSLVKIYQNMKPKDAARIFEELDMDLLIQVVNKMKEAKSAPIIALMNPDRARALTINIASKKVKPEFCNCSLGK